MLSPMRAVSLPIALVAVLALPALALAHAEWPTYFPDFSKGSVPTYRTTGPSLVVCKSDSRRRIVNRLSGAMKRKNVKLLKRCPRTASPASSARPSRPRWDEEGMGNCWRATPGAAAPRGPATRRPGEAARLPRLPDRPAAQSDQGRPPGPVRDVEPERTTPTRQAATGSPCRPSRSEPAPAGCHTRSAAPRPHYVWFSDRRRRRA